MRSQLLVIGACIAATSSPAWSICRVVQEEGSPPPVIAPDQSVLLVKHNDVVIRSECSESDAGPTDAGDAGTVPDASLPFSFQDTLDAGLPPDPSDGSVPDAGGEEPPACEEIRGEAITMVVQPEFSIGEDGARFALLMVTPSWPIVAVADQDILHDLAVATSPQVFVQESFIEDVSLGYQCNDPKWNSGNSGNSGGGCGPGYSTTDDSWRPTVDEPTLDEEDPDVPIVETIGAYEVARLDVADTAELAEWLGEFSYLYSEDDLQATQPYIEEGWTVVAVRVRHDFGHHGGITPLSFSWAGSELRLPTGISVAPAPSESHLTVYVSADQRYDFPQSQISYAQPGDLGGRPFLTRSNIWVDLSLGAAGDPIAFASSGEVRESVTVERVVRIPVSDCPRSKSDNDEDDDIWGCGCNVREVPGIGSLLLLSLCAWGLRRRKKR